MTTVFLRNTLPIYTSALYYQALVDSAQKYFPRLSVRLAPTEQEARELLESLRSDSIAFQEVISTHLEVQSNERDKKRERTTAMRSANLWISLIRKAGSLVAKRLSDPDIRESLRASLGVGVDYARNSCSQVSRELSRATLGSQKNRVLLCPPLHLAEVARGPELIEAIHQSSSGKQKAELERSASGSQRLSEWKELETRALFILEVARLEFSREEEHPDYPIRLEFEGLDEQFLPQKRRAKPTPLAPTSSKQ